MQMFGVDSHRKAVLKILQAIRVMDPDLMQFYDKVQPGSMKRGNHFLHYAASLGHIELLKEFYEEGIRNQLTKETLLMSAVRFNKEHCVRWLAWTETWLFDKNIVNPRQMQNQKDALQIAEQL